METDTITKTETETPVYGKCRVTNKQSAFFGEEFEFRYFPSPAGYREGNRSIHTLAKVIPSIDTELPAPIMSFSDSDIELIEVY